MKAIPLSQINNYDYYNKIWKKILERNKIGLVLKWVLTI